MPDSTQNLLTKIENREIVLPEFQREFTWKQSQSRDLVDSLLKGYPVGSLLLWKTADVPALKNMPNFEPNGRVEVLLDGQQRLTSLYMLTKDSIPPFYSDRDIDSKKDPRKLYYNLETRNLRYYKRLEMQNNPRWVRVADCFGHNGAVEPRSIAQQITDDENERFEVFAELQKNLDDLKGILKSEPPVMYVQNDANLQHALTVFDRVNSNGTALSEADIALAHMCSQWPNARRVFKEKRAELKEQGFEFALTFFIRATNAVTNGRAEYHILHDATEDELISGWNALDRLMDYLINFLRDRAYIYSTDDLNTTNVLIPMLGYLAQNKHAFQDERKRNRLLYWMYAALYLRRYSGSVDQKLERDLNSLNDDHPIEGLIATLREDHGSPEVKSSQLDTRSVSHPFYNMMQVLIRASGGVDWSNGLKLSKPIGSQYSLERHHIFPKSVLSKVGYDTGSNLIDKKRVHEIANRVPLTREGNMDIFSKPPAEYLPKVQEANPGNLEKFMIPMNPALWEVENYESFLQERRELIAGRINQFMQRLIDASESANDGSDDTSTEAIIHKGESEMTEFKSTLRWHLYAERNDKEIEHACLKTIAAFLNSDGGTLLIGVDDDGELTGFMEYDQFDNPDKAMLHLTNIVKERIGTSSVRFLRMSVDTVGGEHVMRVDCKPSVVPVYLDHENDEHFYVRTGPSTSELRPSEIAEYVQHQFYDA